ncbi:hypothetical protein INH39_11055 [Massilia violaceinigra]|uniref:Uncharacterized protein n=1 Tax=Massilia violaceinigra TaxID=2045208 RepID=A0ABY4AHV2_9BURK|nr:hypothetical protein [Massilia violaceinigra]UOD32153.1 hypothetical protein INH39_11055 [Massilia violaceinigra]
MSYLIHIWKARSLKWTRHPVSLEFETAVFCDGPHVFRAWDSDTAASAMLHLKRFILNVVLPFLDYRASLEDIDRLLNDPLRGLGSAIRKTGARAAMRSGKDGVQ